VLLKGVGRPQIVYGHRCKEDQLEHEVWVTEAELLLGGPFTRNVEVGKTTADGLLICNADRFYIEVDNETMTTKQMRQKWRMYENVDGFILVICHTKNRLRKLIRSAAVVKTAALFTRFRWLRSTRVSEPWVDWYCHRVAI
jgi:hypothetical protein